MDKDKFLFLLSNSASLTQEETNELAKLQDAFPYSQAIHNLVARGAHLNQFSTKQALLTTAAVYATDRAVLKAIVTALPGAREVKPAAIAPKEEVVTKAEIKPSSPPQKVAKVKDTVSAEELPKKKPAIEVSSSIKPAIKQETKKEIDVIPEFKGSKLEGDELIDELFHDLEKLKKLKNDFEVSIAQFDKMPVPEIKASSPKPKEKKKKFLRSLKINLVSGAKESLLRSRVLIRK